jgi:hypothetical protein
MRSSVKVLKAQAAECAATGLVSQIPITDIFCKRFKNPTDICRHSKKVPPEKKIKAL